MREFCALPGGNLLSRLEFDTDCFPPDEGWKIKELVITALEGLITRQSLGEIQTRLRDVIMRPPKYREGDLESLFGRKVTEL